MVSADTPTADEINALYDANARLLGGQRLNAVRVQVEDAVRQHEQQDRYGAFVKERWATCSRTGTAERGRARHRPPLGDLTGGPLSRALTSTETNSSCFR